MARNATQARELIRPSYKIVRDLRGGLNTSKPPDQIADNESPDCLNVTYLNKALAVDFGLTRLGSALVGIPLQPIEWTSSTGASYELVVTSRTLYAYNSTVADWLPIPTNTTANPSVNGAVVGAGVNPAIVFTGTATWIASQLIGALMDNGRYLIGIASGTTSPVTIATVLPVGRTILTAHDLLPLPTFTSDGSLPISFIADPIRGELQFVNGFDLPQTFDGSICVPLGGVGAISLTTARFIARFNYVTVLAATTEGGIFRTYRVRRSATADSTNWSTLNAGFDDLSDSDDDITALFPLNPRLVIARRSSLMLASYYGSGQQVFWYDYGVSGVGCFGLNAGIATKMASMVIDHSGIYYYQGSNTLSDMGDKIFNSFLSFSGDLKPGTEDTVVAFYVELLDEVWIIYQPTSATAANTLLRYSYKTGSWFKRVFATPLAFKGAGSFTFPTARRWLDLGAIRWIDQQQTWNARTSQANFRSVLLCGATDNFVYLYNFSATSDNGAAINWYYNTKDYAIPEDWTTVDGLVFYGQGTIDLVEISMDGGIIFRTVGTNIQMGTTWRRKEIDMSLTCDFIRIRISGTNPSFRLSWFALKTMKTSEH